MASELHRTHKTIDMTRIFKTEKKIRREARDCLIYDEYTRLTAEEGNSHTKVVEHLAKKHDLSTSGVYLAINRQKRKYNN